jgi:hypothetical protein
VGRLIDGDAEKKRQTKMRANNKEKLVQHKNRDVINI